MKMKGKEAEMAHEGRSDSKMQEHCETYARNW